MQRDVRAHPVRHADMTAGVELEQDLDTGPPTRDGEERRLAGRVAETSQRRLGDVDETAVRVGGPRQPDELVAENPTAARRVLDEAGVRERPQRPSHGRAREAGHPRQLRRRRAAGSRGHGTKQRRSARPSDFVRGMPVVLLTI